MFLLVSECFVFEEEELSSTSSYFAILTSFLSLLNTLLSWGTLRDTKG